jgi:hypothetical protein
VISAKARKALARLPSPPATAVLATLLAFAGQRPTSPAWALMQMLSCVFLAHWLVTLARAAGYRVLALRASQADPPQAVPPPTTT